MCIKPATVANLNSTVFRAQLDSHSVALCDVCVFRHTGCHLCGNPFDSSFSQSLQPSSVSLIFLQVLTALDRAQRELGFVHGDMRIANIMEHRINGASPEPEFLPRGFHAQAKKRSSVERTRGQAEHDSGLGLLSEDEFKLPGICRSIEPTLQALPRTPLVQCSRIYDTVCGSNRMNLYVEFQSR